MSLNFRAAIAVMLMLASLATTTVATASGYLQCVPFARAASGVAIHGNARDWWASAAGRYERGNEPRIGAVMHFPGTRAMPIGHVAVVARIVSDREVLIDHANWSWRGQIERGVRVIDVSPNNDWSMVRVWYGRINGLGLRANPVSGFIYPNAARGAADSTTIAATVVTEPANG